MEEPAVLVIKRAVELDLASRFQESLVCYQEGIDLLLRVLKGEAGMPGSRRHLGAPRNYSSPNNSLNEITDK